MKGIKQMRKILYLTDIHYGCTPITRKDDYNASILGKLAYAFAYARKHNLIVVIGGDLFDRPHQSIITLIPLIHLLRQYSDLTIICNRGNPTHDGHMHSSPLTLLEETDLLITSDNKDFMDIDGFRLIFAPNSGMPDDKDRFLSDTLINCLITHHLIVDKPVIYDHYLMEELTIGAEFVFCADYHPYQGVKVYNDTTFIAPGSIARRKRTKDNINKTVRMVVFDGKKVKEVIIPCEKDIWMEKDETKLETAVEININDFKMEMEKVLDDVSLETTFKSFCDKADISKEVYEYMKKRMF